MINKTISTPFYFDIKIYLLIKIFLLELPSPPSLPFLNLTFIKYIFQFPKCLTFLTKISFKINF